MKYGVKATDEEVYDFLRNFDENGDFKLNLTEFAEFISNIPPVDDSIID